MYLGQWLTDSGLGIRVEFHGYTANGWLWVADFTKSGTTVWMKQNPEVIMVEQLRGWGQDPSAAVSDLIQGTKGYWIILQHADSNGQSEKIVQIPELTLLP